MSLSLLSLMRDDGAAPPPPVLVQFLSFGLVGGLAALGYVVLSMLLIGLGTGLPDWLVSALCYAAFVVPVYLAHRRFSFRSDLAHGVALPRYVAVQAGALLLAAVFSFICYEVLGLASWLAAPLVIVLTSGVNFALLRLWAFAAEAGQEAGMGLLGLADPRRLLNAAHGTAVFGRRVRVLAAHLANAIPPDGGRVLDLGSGDGSVAAELMRLRPDLRVEGVDVMLRPTSRIRVSLYDGRTLPFADASFDYVTIVDVLHHTDDPTAVLAEAARVARRGVVVKDHLLEGPLAAGTLRFMDWVGNRGHGVVLPYNYLGRRQWDAAFDRAGLVRAAETGRLGLYPAPFSWLFDRHLHFVARLAPRAA